MDVARCHSFSNISFCSPDLSIFTEQVTISLPPVTTNIVVNKTGFLHCVASFDPKLDLTYTWYQGDMWVEFEKVFRLGENRYQIWRNPHYFRVRTARKVQCMPGADPGFCENRFVLKAIDE